MRWKQLPYGSYMQLPLAQRHEIRRFSNCIVLAAEQEGRLYIILEEPWQRATLCEYDSREEHREDILYLHSLPGGNGGTAGSGVPVLPVSPPPSRTAKEAKPLPVA